MMTPEQCRMARAALDLSIAELATAAQLRPMTISGFERGADCRRSTVEALEAELKARGVMFISADDRGGPGVRLRA
jgi:transcriptional regulator with XRE-family HTH domain